MRFHAVRTISGAIAGIGLAAFAFGVIITLIKLPHSRRYAYGAMLLPIALHTQVELPFYISSLHWFVFTVCCVTSKHTTLSA
ncbi:MAG: hypothetical protein RQ783_05105 [Gammaproteobacteria bacterium]|nr:hypothetical protein [Gammaproteobacteria bacterium]